MGLLNSDKVVNIKYGKGMTEEEAWKAHYAIEEIVEQTKIIREQLQKQSSIKTEEDANK